MDGIAGTNQKLGENQHAGYGKTVEYLQKCKRKPNDAAKEAADSLLALQGGKYLAIGDIRVLTN